MTPDELEARKKKKPYRHTDLRRRKYRKDRMDEETHAMDKPKPLEVVSDGDLSEVKKDPVWKTWLEKEAPLKRMDARGRGIADEYHTGDVKTDKYCDTKTRKQEARNKPTKESLKTTELLIKARES